MDIEVFKKYFIKHNVLEIGGPSKWLESFYSLTGKITYLNHRASMEAHHHTQIGNNIRFGDATNPNDLNAFKNIKFDLLILSHTFEHIANPIKALFLWKKLLSNNGVIINIVPDKNHCWDKERPYTDMNHLIKDYEKNITENDMTHVDEASCMIVSRPNYYNDVGEDNENRVIHHHVYSKETLTQVHEMVGFKTLECDNLDTDRLQLIYIGENYE